MKILLLGKTGQIGQAFQALAATDHWPIAWDLIPWGREEADLSKPDSVLTQVEKLKPDVIINAAAYTQVDKAESERELCETINATMPEKLAAYCAQLKIPLVHYSSDYVYAGTGTAAHLESEPYSPQNFYGLTKAKGDEAIQRVANQAKLPGSIDALIFRTSWVYSHTGKNFVLTMLRLGRERDSLNVVEDQVGSPSYAPDLAEYSLDILMQALERKVETGIFPSGVYHLCNSGFTTWADFARAILPGKTIKGILTSEYPTPAKRPLNSRLSLKKIETAFGIKPRSWQEALQDCLKGISHE